MTISYFNPVLGASCHVGLVNRAGPVRPIRECRPRSYLHVRCKLLGSRQNNSGLRAFGGEGE